MITCEELFALSSLIVSIITLVLFIQNNKKVTAAPLNAGGYFLPQLEELPVAGSAFLCSLYQPFPGCKDLFIFRFANRSRCSSAIFTQMLPVFTLHL